RRPPDVPPGRPAQANVKPAMVAEATSLPTRPPGMVPSGQLMGRLYTRSGFDQSSSRQQQHLSVDAAFGQRVGFGGRGQREAARDRDGQLSVGDRLGQL